MAAAASPGAPGQLAGPIKIVSSLPRIGPAKTQTDSIVFAIKLALDEVSSRVDGAQIVYEDWDDATAERNAWDAGKEAENAQKAAADPDAMVYLGPYNSGAARVAIPILNGADLVAISPSATYSGLTRPGRGDGGEPESLYPNGKRNFARTIPADEVQGAAAAFWAKSLGANKVYVLHDTELYGRTLAAAFAEQAGKLGMQVIGPPEAVDPRAPDFFGIAGKVKSASPDLVYYGGLTENSASRVFKELRASLGPNVRLMGPDGLYQPTFVEALGDASEGVLVTFSGIAPSKLTGRGGEWYRSFKVRTGAEPEVYAAYAYEATKVALDAIKRAGRKDRAAIRDAVLATRDYDGILGRWSFDANGDTTLNLVSGREVKGAKFDDTGAVTLSATGQ
ncbi:MAG: branched-chain amino acid ABC transporter substrate-binding protein [Chloroflexi bacterium]|nr:branched-chain amino acid ABC transporter substrate-binding protein [Chloroflexota bacterium]